MNGKKYLVYLDILGFEDLAREIAERTGFEEDVIRQNYLSDPLEKKIEEIKREGIQISKGISEIEGSDNYVLIVDHIQTAFELVGKLTTIRIPHKAYKFIPLEVGLGTKEIDEDIGVKPINRKEIIKFLKSDIINPYRSYYKKKHGEKIKETFVLFAPDFFDDLEPLDRKYCERISYKTKTFFAADVDKVQQRGRVFEFLEKIGYTGSKWYGRIDEVYVPPLEYEDMAETLKEKRIVFITGTPEYGKTYTAVRLLWKYYNNGYEPGWIKGGEAAERIEVRRKLEDISAELKPCHIIYFEDPFGRTKYERREGLEREIGTIIDTVRQVEHAYVVITSREEVFKEFEKEKLSAKDLKEFEKKLNVKKLSYSYKKRKKILLMWAEEENCKWLGNEELKELVLESIKDEKILPTPLSIKDFAMATFDIEKESELKEKIEEKSKETAKAFAEEIKNMTNDKILFLSFPFISSFEVEFVRATYQELVKELNLKDAWEFDRVLNWFKDDKVNIIDSISGRGVEKVIHKLIKFSQPSYSEALPCILVEDRYITLINKEIFSKLLLKLAEKDKAAKIVALNVHDDMFDKLSEDVMTGLLFKLSENDEAAWIVARLISRYFDRLPEEVRSGLLLKLSERGYLFNWDNVPGDDNEKLKGYFRDYFGIKWTENAEICKSNDGKTIRILKDANSAEIKINEKKEEATLNIGDGIIRYLKFKNENDKLNIYKWNNTAWAVAQTVAEHFTELPECVRILLDRLQMDLQDRIDYLSGKMEDEIEQEESDAFWMSAEEMQCVSHLKLGAIFLILNAKSKIDKTFALDTLGRLSEDWDEKVRTKAKALMNTISEDLKGDNEC